MNDTQDKKIKITHVFKSAYPTIGGIESVISQINDLLPNEKYEKEVLCCSNDHKSAVENGVRYIRCPYICNFASNNISLHFIWELHKVDTDILHYQMPCIFAVLAHFIARPKYKKLYISYQSDITIYPNLMRFFWGLYRRFMSKADKIHVLSPGHISGSAFLQQYKDKCVVVPHGMSMKYDVDYDKVQALKDKYKGKKILFSLGRHVWYKGFIYALEAMKNIDNAVYLLGGSGKLTETFKEYIKENNLQDKVVLTGRLSEEDISVYYEACDIYLFPSVGKTECYGIVQVDAMRHGKPIINTWLNNGVNYVSVDNETGITVEPENVEQLTNAINKLINNDELRLQYGQNAKKRAQDLFDIEKVREGYQEFYGA